MEFWNKDEYLSNLADGYTRFASGSLKKSRSELPPQAVEIMRQSLTNGQRTIPAFKLIVFVTLGQDDAVREKPYHRVRSPFIERS